MEKRHKPPPISSFPGPPPYLLEPGESSSSYRPLLPPLNTKEAYYNVCPHCSREFCRTCRVAWHSGITCEDHSEVAAKNEDEVVLMMAEEFRWRRCPRCSFLVEKISGCSHVKCRCGCHFCYKCGFDKLRETPYHQCDRTRARITFPNHRNPYQFPQMVPAQVISSLNYQVPTEGLHNHVVVISSYPLEPPAKIR